MPTQVYRFRLDAPGLDIGQLRAEVNDPTANVNALGGATFIDIDADTAVKDDLIDSLLERGYAFVEEAPVTTPVDAFNGTLGVLDKPAHDAFRSLIHFIDNGPANGFASGAFRKTTGGVFPTLVTWFEDNTETQKIVELTITRNANRTPATEMWRMYDTDGTTVLCTVTDTIAYSGVTETSRTRTIV